MPQLSLGNGYEIDLADGWTFVHALEDARDQLRSGWVHNCEDLIIDPPGNDGHSRTFAAEMTQRALDAHRAWYNVKMQELGTMIQNATGILHEYGIAETANTIQWTATGTDTQGTDNQGKGGGRGAN